MTTSKHLFRNRKYLLTLFCLIALSFCGFSQRYMENLSRGLVGMRFATDSVFLSWRLLGTEDENTPFNIYRVTGSKDTLLLNSSPLTEGTNFIDVKPDFSKPVSYFVRTLVDGNVQAPSNAFDFVAYPPVQSYFTVALQTLPGHTPNDISLGDLDGDGDYDIVIKQEMKPRDNSHKGITGQTKLEAYKMDGTFLWRINLGKNIREGAHYTQFLVYDLDCDGRAEVVCKTADGTIDGKGNVIGDSLIDNRNEFGHILKGNEFLTVFDGLTGAERATVNYIPARHPKKVNPSERELKQIWGDGHGNRSDRYLACIAYLDGVHPSVVMCRGYYTRATMAAWNFSDNKLKHLWTFDSDDGTPGNDAFHGQGNHSVAVGDVDNDGKDEIVYGAAIIDDNGKGLYSTRLGHADALHFSDLDPTRPGLEVFNIQERFDDAGMNFRDAATGEILWKVASVKAATEGGDKGEGPGRGVAFNVDPRFPGAECWAFGAGISGMYSAKGEKISDQTPRSCNFAVWWDGDLLREILDKTFVAKWDWNEQRLNFILSDRECSSNNGSKGTPAISADIFGDWREEIIWRTKDNKALRIYSTTIPTEHRFYTLMHDPIYRLSVAWQNVTYNQPPHPGFYIGDDMKKPPKPNIRLVGK